MFSIMIGNVLKRTPALYAVVVRVSSTYEAHQSSRFMQKLINKKGAKTKKQWYKAHLGEPLEVESKRTRKGMSHSHSVRLRQHSHVLYDKITEIINTGELSQEILDKQVSILSVKMHKDMNNLSIYWDADRKDSESVEQLLQAHCGKLRSLLISYHILGRIPHIVFVQDKASVNLNQLERLYAVADYGPDYTPGTSVERNLHWFNHEDCYTHNGPNMTEPDDSKVITSDYNDYLNDSVRNNLDSTNEQFHAVSEQSEILDDHSINGSNLNLETLATAKDFKFRSDLYGLCRDDIMKKVLAKKKKRPDIVTSESSQLSPSLDFDPNSDVLSGINSSVLQKAKAKQQLAKEERRWKERMLYRDDFEQ